jgi:pilus assembly protein CpaC
VTFHWGFHTTLLFGATWIAGIAFVPSRAQTATPVQAPEKGAEPDQVQGSPHELFVIAGKSVVLNSQLPIERVSVGFGEVAEAVAVSPREVLVNGKAPGETSLIIWQRGGDKLFFDVIVRPNTSEVKVKVLNVRRELKKQLPGQNVNLSFENNTVFLSGTVDDLTTAERAEAIASTLGKTVNLLYVSVPPTEPQILLNVKFASVDRSVSSELGLNLVSTGATNSIGGINTGQFSPPKVTRNADGKVDLTLSDALNIFLLRPDLNLAATIKALQARGLFEVLAEPNVLAINGKLASFLAGGEFPFPTLQGGGGGLGAVTIQFREFGVRLNFVATVTPRGTIRLELAPEVSALDYTNGLVFQGFNIPALTVRRVHTEIELEPGQSFAIGGLLDRRLTETLMRVPVLADVPVLGNLFKSRSLHKENSELLIIATPEFVRPMPAGQSLPGLKYPRELPEPITGSLPRQPGSSITGPAPAVRQRQSIPLEELRQGLQAPPVSLQGPQGSGLPNTATPFQQNLPATAPPVPQSPSVSTRTP